MIETMNILTNNMNNLSNPQASYLFEVQFFDTAGGDLPIRLTQSKEAVAIRASLPKQTLKTTTKWFAGTPKTFTVNANRDGETTMEFIVRSEGLKGLKELLNLPTGSLLEDSTFRHNEYRRFFDLIKIYLIKNTSADFNNIGTEYSLYNCIPTNVDFGDVSYEGTDYVRCSVTIHYDWWDCK